MPNGLKSFTSNHSYLTGIAITVVGLLGLYGAISGNLAPMIAAIFDTSVLRESKEAKTGSKIPFIIPIAKTGGSGGTGGEGKTAGNETAGNESQGSSSGDSSSSGETPAPDNITPIRPDIQIPEVPAA